MYNITMYEEGRFCTNIGGAVPTLPEAIKQIDSLRQTLNGTDTEDYFGFKFDRAGTTCSIIVTDRWNFPIKNEQNYEK